MNEPILQFFAYSHLPEALQGVSKPLRKLLEAKDAAVRAKLFVGEGT